MHFYSLGASQRGPSLRLPYTDIATLGSEYLFGQCQPASTPASPQTSDDGASDSGYASSQNSPIEAKHYDLYLPAPAHLARDQAYRYHLTTRNFFAYATAKPVVGERLGSTLANLLERIREWQPKSPALANFSSYCQGQGYQDMAENVDCAVACLALAEQAKMRSLWVEAFVHCTGMHERVYSPEFTGLSATTQTLIARASMEMDLHISRAIGALGSFLEEELGPENLGLTKPARDHLDRFRSFLHNYYVDKLGYYPPGHVGPYRKRLWTKMYHAFHCLYEYLVDRESSSDLSYSRAATGGICVRQNVEAFDRRHGYEALPHPLPLLPSSPSGTRAIRGARGLRNFKSGKQASDSSEHRSLEQAANLGNMDVLTCELVQNYQRFEREKLEEKLTAAEARKVRWLLIYGALQMLISITRAPREVRDTETPSYPLCVPITESPDFEDAASSHQRVPSDPRSVLSLALDLRSGQDQESEEAPSDDRTGADEDRISIHPDCEAETAEDYFAAQTLLARIPSDLSFDMTPPPLRLQTQLSRTASFRSSVNSGVHALSKSFVGSKKRRNSLRQTPTSATQPLSKSNSFCEIFVEGYGNGAEVQEDRSRRQSIFSLGETAETDYGLHDVNEEPVFEDRHTDYLRVDDTPTPQAASMSPCNFTDVVDDDDDDHMITRNTSLTSIYSTASSGLSSPRSMSPVSAFDSPSTALSSDWSNPVSNRSSASSAVEPNYTYTTSTMSSPKTPYHPPSLQQSTPRRQKRAGGRSTKDRKMAGKASAYSLQAGCYTPTGLPGTFRAFERNRPCINYDEDEEDEYQEEDEEEDDDDEGLGMDVRGRRRLGTLRMLG